ncbi:hypothetical protein EEB15_05520 [Ramlibacter sp. WS9]|nr:hypothetical protein EEB15_05520 [Ramlibacter sp. WS9]
MRNGLPAVFRVALTHIYRLQLAVLAVLVVSCLFWWQGKAGFSLWDEGFLWYGAQRVMLGEVPIRDFMAYDPARYYWSATLMSAWGDSGIVALRRAVAIFQVIGLFTGLLLLSRVDKTARKLDGPYLLLSAAVLALWMFPRHKLFDASASILSIGILAYLIQNPTGRRYLLSGVCVGFVAMFGRNHGVYAGVASIGAIGWLSMKRPGGPGACQGLAIWATGVLLGFSPILLMALLVPGFAAAFWESIRYVFEVKATNLPLPVPWPWQANFSTAPFGHAIRDVLVGLFFLATILFGAFSIGWVIYREWQAKPVIPVLAATAWLALPYAHYAYSRADVGHLALGIFPFLIGCLAVLATQAARIKWPGALLLCAASFWVMHIFHPGWQCRNGRCVNVEISGDQLRVDRVTADDVALLRRLATQYAQNGEAFVVAPNWPGAYPLLQRKSPMWEIYALWPRSDSFERAEIERIKASNPQFALIWNFSLDGNAALQFRHTHPLTHQYILENFDPLPAVSNPAYGLFKARKAAQ